MRRVRPHLGLALPALLLALSLGLSPATGIATAQGVKPEDAVSRLIAQGSYEAAERMALAELARDAKETGARSLRVAFWYNRLGQVAHLDGRHDLALKRFRAAYDIRRARLGPDHGDTLIAQNNVALVLAKLGSWREAETLMREALAGNRRLLGPGHPRTVTTMTNLGLLCLDMGKQAEATTLLEDALALTRKADNSASDHLATSLSNLATAYMAAMDFAKAEPLLEEALALDMQRHGPSHPTVATTRSNMGQLYHGTGRLADAEKAYLQALEIDRAHRAGGHPDNTGTHASLAALYRDMGNATKARDHLAAARTAAAAARGTDIDAVALSTLAELLSDEGRHAEAQALLWQAIAAIEQRLGAAHPATAPLLMQLAATRFTTTSNPRTLAFKAHEIITRAHGVDSAPAARSALNVTRILVDSGSIEDALSWAGQARTQIAVHFGTASFDHALGQYLYAKAAFAVGRRDAAEVALAGALPGLEAVLPARADIAADAHVLMSRLLMARDEPVKALTHARTASRLADARHRHDTIRARLTARPADAAARRTIHENTLRTALAAISAGNPAGKEQALATSFAMADRLLSEKLHHALAMGSLRSGLPDDDARRRLDALAASVAALDRLEARYEHALSVGAASTQAATWREQFKAHARAVADADRALRAHKAYQRHLAMPQPGLADIRKVLAPSELLVMIVPLADGHYVLATTQTKAAWHRMEMKPADIAREVDALRAQLDPARWTSSLPPFNRARSHRLYRAVLGPLKDQVRSTTRILFLIDGPLRSLPMATLVTRPVLESERADSAPSILRETAWLIRSHTITTYPSLASILSLRHKEPPPQDAPWKLVGVGAPVTPPALSLAPLLHAQAELDALRHLGAATILTGRNATHEALGALDLAHTRILAFATHALPPDRSHPAPALILSADAADDARLEPWEIARLQLDRTFVVLSACNTAGSGGSGADMLADAFLRAGATSLMHTHWQVFDRNAAGIAAAAISQYRSAPGDGQAAALRKAMLATLADRAHPLNAHPASWAAFSIVGETRGQ